MGFGMITSGKALWSRAGKSIMPNFFTSLSKLLLHKYSVHVLLLLSCVCLNALEANF